MLEADTLRARIRERLEASELDPVPLAANLGKGRDYITDFLRGRKAKLDGTFLDAIARATGTNPRYFLDPDASVTTEFEGYPLLGKVGAGGMGLYSDDPEDRRAATEWFEPLPGMPTSADIIALETDGNSMVPLVYDGDLAFFGPVRKDVDALLNQRVMARLHDGRKYFKILKKGDIPGRYTLRSLNLAENDIENVEVSWVLPYRGSRPRGIG